MPTSGSFEPLPEARHRIQIIDGTEWIVVNAARNWFVLPFLSFWLVLWTVGGIAAMAGVARGPERGFLAIWLIFWALGWLFAAGTIAWQFTGRTFVGVAHGALVHRWTMMLLSKTRQYDARHVGNLRAATSIWSMLRTGFMRSPYPPFLPMGGGSIAFDYGARTVRLLPEVDESEGQMIVDWLTKRLPRR
jgi:hypothetical protein